METGNEKQFYNDINQIRKALSEINMCLQGINANVRKMAEVAERQEAAHN